MIRPLVTALAVFPLCLAAAGIAEARVHVIAGGETLQSIAQREHVTVEDIARFNQLQGPLSGPLVVGRMLALDAASAAALPAPAAPRDDVANELSTSIQDGDDRIAAADMPKWSGLTSLNVAKFSPVRRFAGRILTRASRLAVRLTRNAMRFIGTPYVFGGTGRFGFDCSGYVQHVFALLGIHLPRTADSQYYAGHSTGGRMLAGDLVFFQTYSAGPSHVGIYLGKGKFVHASSSRGVEVSRLSDGYWASRYLGARRYVAASRAATIIRATTE